MVNLIIVLVSIALFGTMLLAGLNHLNTNTIKERNYVSEIELATTSAVNIIDGYRLANGIPLSEAGWRNTIKDYGSLPNVSFESEWKYAINSGESYICLVAKDDASVNNAFTKLSSNNFYTLGNKCETPAPSGTTALSTKI